MDGDPVDVVARGVFEPAECSLSSSWRELRGAARVFDSVAARCAGRSVVLRVDSLVSAYVFASGGSQNRGPDGALDLHPEVLDLEQTAARLGIDLGVVWWPRAMNTLADVRSKIVDRGNYALSRAAFAEVERRFGLHTIDRFADDRNALLARFNSRWCCVGSEGVDALAIQWGGENNWLHPPTSIISRVIAKLRADRAAGTLLVPRWRAAPWWPVLYPRDARSPVRAYLPISAARGTFVAMEEHAAVGVRGASPWWPMVALRLDFTAARAD